MISRVLKWSGGLFVITLLLICLAVAWLLATESGARWLLATATPRLPSAMQIDEVHGTLLGGLNFRSLRWQDAAATVTVAELDTELELMPLLNREVRINTLDFRDVDVFIAENTTSNGSDEASSVDLPVSLQIQAASLTNAKVSAGGAEITIDTARLSGELSGSSLRIDRFDLQSPLGDIALSGDAELGGSYTASATAAWNLRLQDQPPLSGVLKLRGDTARYEVQHELDAPYEIETTGTLAFIDSSLSVDLANTWQQLRLANSDMPTVEFVDGTLHVGGTVDELDFDGASVLVLEGAPPFAVETRGKLATDRIVVESLAVNNDWGRLNADGEMLLSPEPSWIFNMAFADLDPAAADARLSGKLQVIAKTAGRLVQQQPVLDLNVDQIFGDLNGYPVDGGGVLAFAGKQLRFDNAFVRVGGNRIDFDGSYGQQLQINARARFADIAQVGLDAAGALNGDVRLATDFETFRASGKVSGENLAWGEYAVDRLDADVSLPATGDGTVILQLASADHGKLAVEIDGRFVNRQWLGTVNKLSLIRDPVGEWNLRNAADFSLSKSQFDLGNFCLVTPAIAGDLCAEVNYAFSGALRFEASVDAVPLAALTPDLPEGASVLGDLSARASGRFANGRLNANVGMQVDGLGLNATFEGDKVSANFEKASAKANVVDNTLATEFEFRLENSADHAVGGIEVANILDRQSALRGQGSLEFNDLALLSFFSPDLANATGKIFGRLNASGSLMTPEIVGEVGLSDGSVDIRRAGITITDVDIVLRQSKAGELALEGSAKSGDGYLSLTGETSISAETGIRTDIRLGGENFTLVQLPDMQAIASPDIAVLFDEHQTRVSGQLLVPAATITVQTVPASAKKPSPDAVVHRGTESVKAPQRKLVVDVTTRLGERVFFSGFGLSTRLDGSVRLRGDSTSPYRGSGRVGLRDGRYEAYGQDLEIDSGELVFNGPLTNPSLNVRAKRTASDKTVVGIHLSGTPSALRSDVYSEPPLADAEALSYLLTGRPLNNANSEEGDMLNQAAFALGLTGAGNVASRIQNELGLDTLGVQGGSENRQLVAGKQIGNRLFVEYAYGMIDSVGTLLLRYQLNRRIVVESRSGATRVVDVVYSVKKP